MPRAKDASARADKSPRLFLVGALPELRSVRAMRELQHFDDAPQAAQSSRMPLLRFAPANSEAMPEVPIQIRLFLWRRLRASGRTPAQRISRRRSEEHTSELQSLTNLVCRLLLEKKKKKNKQNNY